MSEDTQKGSKQEHIMLLHTQTAKKEIIIF